MLNTTLNIFHYQNVRFEDIKCKCNSHRYPGQWQDLSVYFQDSKMFQFFQDLKNKHFIPFLAWSFRTHSPWSFQTCSLWSFQTLSPWSFWTPSPCHCNMQSLASYQAHSLCPSRTHNRHNCSPELIAFFKTCNVFIIFNEHSHLLRVCSCPSRACICPSGTCLYLLKTCKK